MSGRNQRDLGKEKFWRGMVRRWRSSGLSVRAFCENQGLLEPAFYSWRRTLAARAAERTPPGRKVRTQELPAFVPVQVAAAARSSPTLEVVLGPGRVIRVPADFDAAALRSLLAILEEAPPC